jgi:SagB-type dehydrogenase family enzyme
MTQELPAPRLTGQVSLEEVLARRRSVRSFEATALTEAEIAQLSWAAQGSTTAEGLRTAPSAGALYPLELYVALPAGLYRYDSDDHRLKTQSEKDLREELQRAALGQDAIGDAPAVFVITGVYERTAIKYGERRTPRYVQMEAGHAAQNLLLQAVALGLGAVPIGAFYDDSVRDVLALDVAETPLYLIPVGHARR